MAQHAAIVASAGKDADQIVLVTDQPDATKAPLIAWAQERGVRLLELPQHIIIIEQMPVLPTGKTDYSAIRSMLAERFCKT